MDSGLHEKQRIEIDYWRKSENEMPQSESLNNVFNKVSDAAIFFDCLERYRDYLSSDGRVLELGAGQGWAACLYKRIFPSAHVTITDISQWAVDSLRKWEHVWNVKIDDSYACKSYETRESDRSVDVVFCFASAHHFLAHNRTLAEIARILKPGGRAIYFYEPCCPGFLHPLAKWRVNHKRHDVPEDVLVTKKILDLARKNGLAAKVEYYPSLKKRGTAELFYYLIFGYLPFLQRFLPCTANLIFQKTK